LRERDEFGPQAHVDIGVRLRHLQRLFDNLDALTLQDVWKARVVFQIGVIESCDELAFMAVPVMKHWRDDSARLQFLVEPDAVIHFQCRRVIGPRARHLFEKVIVT
jgi:hypothetical protein